MKHVQYMQQYNDVPIYGSKIVAHIGKDGQVKRISGKLIQADITVSTSPTISMRTAIRLAKADLRKQAPRTGYRRAMRKQVRRECRKRQRTRTCQRKRFRRFAKNTRFVKSYEPKLLIYNESFVKEGGKEGHNLVWAVTLMNNGQTSRQLYFINAHTGERHKRDDGMRGLTRIIRDCSPTPDGTCYFDLNRAYVISPGNILEYYHGRSEGSPLRGPTPITTAPYTGSTDVDDVYDMVGQMDNYYMTVFGRDGGNGQGGLGDGANVNQSVTLVDTMIEGGGGGGGFCPNGGGFYSGFGIAFCTDNVTEDLMGHEYSHSVTENSGILAQDESGAIVEAYSDFIGEAFENYVTGSNDWIVGGENTEPFRDMVNPANLPNASGGFPYPLTYTDPLYYCGAVDAGGIHTNASIINLATYLMTEGGERNDCTAQGVGFNKVEQIWYRAVTIYMIPTQPIGPFDGADLDEEEDDGFYGVMNQSCVDLIDSFGITQSDCDQVRIAMEAVKLDQDGGCSGQADPAAPATCALVEGDIDIDLDVDSSDYMVWYDAEGQTGPGLAADLNADNIVDTADCAIWKANFGSCNNGGCIELDMFDGDFDDDGDVDSDDYLIWAGNYGATGAGGIANCATKKDTEKAV